MLRNRNSRHAKSRIAEIRNVKDILFLVINGTGEFKYDQRATVSPHS
jgi:hypothetical protein